MLDSAQWLEEVFTANPYKPPNQFLNHACRFADMASSSTPLTIDDWTNYES